MELVSNYRVSALLASLLAVVPAAAVNYDANYVSAPLTIDGSAADTAWSSASPAATGFVKHDVSTELSQEQTHVRVLWSDTHLYLLYEATDGAIVPSATGNDAGFLFNEVDDAEFFFDPSWRQDGTQNDKMYHIVVDPTANAYTYTEAGQNDTGWNLSPASTLAFTSNGSNWTIEAAIAWDDFNSTATNSPGTLLGPPRHNTIWGCEFGRIHSMDTPPNNAGYTRWNPIEGGFRQRPFATLTFKGGPAATKVDISTGTVTYATGFEAPTFTDGVTVSGIEDFFSSFPEVFTASTAQSLTGNQSLALAAGTEGRTLNHVQHTVNTATPQYVQYAVRLPSEAVVAGSYRHVLYLQGSYASGNPTDPFGQIWFRNSPEDGSNTLGVISYENPADESQTSVTNIMGVQAFDTWNWVTVKVDPTDKKFEVWVNETKLTHADGNDRFGIYRPASFLQLDYAQLYSKNYGTQPVYIDDIKYVKDVTSNVSDWQLF